MRSQLCCIRIRLKINFEIMIKKKNGIKKKLSKQNQEVLNNISARGLEHFH